MATIERRTRAFAVPASTVMCAADDLNGAATTLDVSGAGRVLIIQHANGTAGTVGIDVAEISRDGGSSWTPDPTLLALASDEGTGTVVASGALNAAGVEPVNMAIFKSGPHRGKVLLRIGRGGSGEAGTAWVTGAPQVLAVTIG
ncbi:MAG: hypothetical protein ABI720_13290 [Actinomycetes bacterium]